MTSRHCSFSFPSSGAHRDLPSFPTRRSSDLQPMEGGGWVATHEDVTQVRRVEAERAQAVAEAELFHARRSEEHTSELQSPDHLVCRLLLEKKKQTYNNYTNT